MHKIHRLYRPELFQGPARLVRCRPYFEGWYYRISSPELNLAVIPGVSLAAGDPHAFVQVIRSGTGTSSYARFSLREFAHRRSPFLISLGKNRFTLDRLHLELPDLSADLTLDEPRRWPSSLLSPSSMGPYAFLSFLECYHGIILLSARAEGSVDGRRLAGGRLYVEKDWGVSFPTAWVLAEDAEQQFSRAGCADLLGGPGTPAPAQLHGLHYRPAG